MEISKISIIISTYNSGIILKKCVKNILKNVNKLTYEIIVIDDCSNDYSTDFLENQRFFKDKVKLFKLKKNKGVGYCRDYGAKKSKYQYLVYIDADLIIKKNSINYLINSYKDNLTNVGSVGAIPNFKNLNKKNFSSEFVFLRSVFGIYNLDKDSISSNIQSEFCLIKKSFLLKIGSWKAYKSSGGEEFELGNKIERRGKKNILCCRAKYDTYYADIILRFKKIVRRTEVYIPILLNNKKFDSTGSSATSNFALSAFTTLLMLLLIISNSFFSFTEINKALFFFFLLHLIFEINFFYFVWKKNKILLPLSLIGVNFLNFAIIIGSLKFLIKKFKNLF